MTFNDADRIVAEYLSQHWTALPIAWENIEAREWSAPGQPLLPKGNKDYLSVLSDPVNSRNITVSRTCVRRAVQYQFAVCVKQGRGTRSARTHLDSLIALFENRTLSPGLRFSTHLGTAKYATDNGWHVEQSSFMAWFEALHELS